MTDQVLTRSVAAAAVDPHGWRLVLTTFLASVPVDSLHQGLEVSAAATAACADDADDHLRIDVRPDRVELGLTTGGLGGVTARDVQLAEQVSAAVHGLGRRIAPPTGPARPVQQLELAIDTLDRAAIRPFWKAALGYVDQPGEDPPNGIVDPAGELPAIWFQQMDEPRPQRNRIHFDIAVAHDEADARVQAALDAGGTLLTDEYARSFWVLADAEGNEICVCTWQDRD